MNSHHCIGGACNGQLGGSGTYPGYTSSPAGTYYGINGGTYYGSSDNGVNNLGFYAGTNGWYWGLPGNRRLFYARIAHGVLASLAFVFFFPVGAIVVRIIPGRLAVWAHVAIQMFAYVLFIIAAGLGFYMLRKVDIPAYDLVSGDVHGG